MDINELKIKMIKEIKQNSSRALLKQAEDEMFKNEEVLLLIKDFQEKQEDYNFAIKSFPNMPSIIAPYQKRLYESNLKLNNHPIVKKYNDLFKLNNEPLRYLQLSLLDIFNKKGDQQC